MQAQAQQPQWTFVSNHALVLRSLLHDPKARQRDIAAEVGITRGAVQRILHDLADSGHLKIERVGRRNQYRINPAASLRHPNVESAEVGELLAVLGSSGRQAA